MGWSLSLKEGREDHRGTSQGWCTLQLHLGSDGISMFPPHYSHVKLYYFFLLNVLYFPSSKSLLSLCSLPQMLLFQNPLVFVSVSKCLQILPHTQNPSSSSPVNQCIHSLIHFTKIVVCKNIHLSYGVAGILRGTGDDKAQRPSCIFNRRRKSNV